MAVRAGGRNILTFNILPHIRELFDIIGCINKHTSTTEHSQNQTEQNRAEVK